MLNLVRSVYLHTVYRLLGSVIDRIILHSTFHTISIVVTYIAKNRKLKAMPLVRKGFEDHRQEVDIDNTEYMTIFKRLADAYNKAKVEQKNSAQPYRSGVMWQRVLDTYGAYVDLAGALQGNDNMKLQILLENFHREKGGIDYSQMREKPLYKYLFVNTWYKFYNTCEEVLGTRPRLTYPMVGNPTGLYYDGQVISTDTIRFYYCATEILSLLEDVNNPVICEIGSGLGGQAYSILSNSDRAITCILLDLPEALVHASYFLMAAFPEKKSLLYGEGVLDAKNLIEYDIILMPNFVLPQLGDETVDLFFNSNSFSEMDSATVEEYLLQIERICKRYFMHINHNTKFVWDDCGKKTVNMPSTQVKPNPQRFKKIYQHPWLFTRLGEEIRYKGTGRYISFLYERRRPAIWEQPSAKQE